MEKLKCSSCGAVLEVEDDKEYAKCPYCGSKYKLNQDMNINIKLDDNMKEVMDEHLGMVKRSSKFIFLPIIVFILVTATFITVGVRMNRRSSSDYEKSSFNSQFENDGGTKSSFFLESILDDIIQSNKTKKRKISLVFEGRETTDEKEIINIKHSLSGDYEVSINYGDDGYINKIIVEKL